VDNVVTPSVAAVPTRAATDDDDETLFVKQIVDMARGQANTPIVPTTSPAAAAATTTTTPPPLQASAVGLRELELGELALFPCAAVEQSAHVCLLV
jgi:hypothetical protein